MLRSSEVNKVVAEEFDQPKGSGATKLASCLRDNFVGISRDKIQNLNTDKGHYRRNAKFMNKATLKPIRARDVHVRNQIDLMDMGSKGSVKLNGQLYRYVLTVIDIFSRFVWLPPLKSKSSKEVAKELESIYVEHGAPRIIQSDQGGKFKKAVKTLCYRMNIKLIYSRPRHPQSQGKVQRCHRTLKSKIEYDLSKLGQDGVNWAKQLPTYQRILNNDPREEAIEECHLDDVTGDYATENEGNTENDDDVGDSGDLVAEVALGGQKEQLRQNSDGSDMREGEKEHITLQFVPDEDVGVLNLAPRINSNYNMENLPNEVLEQIFKIVLMSSAIVFAGNACHAYQKLCGVNKRFRAVIRNLSSMLPRVYIRGGVQCPQSNQEIRYVKRVGYGITANNFELKMGKCLVGSSGRRI